MKYKCPNCEKRIKKKNKFCPNCSFDVEKHRDLILQELNRETKEKAYIRSKIERKELEEVDKYWPRTKSPGT
jgi:hypothetical protein